MERWEYHDLSVLSNSFDFCEWLDHINFSVFLKLLRVLLNIIMSGLAHLADYTVKYECSNHLHFEGAIQVEASYSCTTEKANQDMISVSLSETKAFEGL